MLAQLKELNNIADWEKALAHSTTRPVFVFKHSTSCPISANAYQEYQSYLNDANTAVDYILVKVIESREVSNKIADDLGVKHESPQAILVKDKQPVWHTSHQAITQESIREATS